MDISRQNQDAEICNFCNKISQNKGMKSILALVFGFLPVLVVLHCVHDEIIKGHKMIPINDTHIHSQRLLQGLGYGPMRFHKQYDQMSINASSNDVISKNIIKLMNIVLEFWSQTIQIDYIPLLIFDVPPNFDTDKVKCLSFNVPERLILNPVPNKDYGVLIEALDDGDSGVTAQSSPCAYSTTTNRPLWGMIQWNKFYMEFNPLNFQQNLYIGLHQVLHILGFSSILYPNYKNSEIFVYNGNEAYLNGPYIREEVKRQYGCQNPPGMSLQTNGAGGTAFSHWSRKTALNQFMTAGVSVNNPTVSYITLALLQQTGWYRKIYKNLGKFINFGYLKGCSMLDVRNCSSNEYCIVQGQKQPDYDQTALGYCKNDSLTKCLYVKYYVNFICTDPNYAQKSLHAEKSNITNTGQAGGMRSRLFASSLILSGQPNTTYSFRCYPTICSQSSRTLTIKIGNRYAFCLFPNQQLTIRGYDGTLRCPSSFQAICAVKRCPGQCNTNGICVDGRCLCSPEYTGQACNQLSSVGFASKADLFNIQQNNNCIEGTFLNEFGSCELCPKNCRKCSRYNFCDQCFGGRLSMAGQC